MQKFNLHTHTKRCGHAVGEDKEYIEEARKSGFDILGFSDHVAFKTWNEPKVRMAHDDMKSYEEAIKSYNEDFDDIKILLGYETEYFPDMNDYYEEILDRVDYLILGQHLIEWNGIYVHDFAGDRDVRLLAERIEEALETGYFTYLCHPDYLMLSRDTYSEDCDIAFREMAQACKNHGVPLELNMNGFARRVSVIDGVEQTTYPFRKAWETIADIGPEVVVGYDSHKPEHLGERDLEKKLKDNFEDLNLNYVKFEDLKNINL